MKRLVVLGVLVLLAVVVAGQASQQQKLQASDAEAGDEFGWAVAIDGDTAIVGAYLEDTGGNNVGAAYVFTRSGSTWSQQQKLQASDADPDGAATFGRSVAIQGDTAVVAASSEDTGGEDAGAVYVFTRSGSTWSEVQKLQASDPEAHGTLGRSMAIDGETLIVGANLYDTGGVNAGAAYIFTGLPFVPPDPTEEVEPTFNPRPIEPGGIFGDNGAAFGGDKAGLATTLQISTTALEISMAILWILLFTAIGFLAFNRSPIGGVAGAVAGVVWSLAWGLIPIWLVFMLIILAAAGFLLTRRRG